MGEGGGCAMRYGGGRSPEGGWEAGRAQGEVGSEARGRRTLKLPEGAALPKEPFPIAIPLCAGG